MLGYTITENGETQQSVTNGYDALGRLASVTEDNTQKVAYTYDRGSRLVKTAYANGVTEERTYNEAGAVKTIETKNASGEILSQYSYTYYVDGNEHTKTDLSGTTEYIYDGLNRLKIALLPDGARQTYTFDDNSNRTKFTVEKNGAVLEETTYTYNKNDQLISESRQRGIETPLITTYTYDAAGNLVEKSGAANAEQTFDVLNRMTGYTEGSTTAAYEYHNDNMRSGKTVNGETTEQVWVNGQIVLDKQGTDVVKYTYGSKLVESDYGWYSYDAHGNVTMLTDDTGAVIKRYDYDPYGVELGAEDSTDENPFRYSGQYTDRETGYVYLRARYYDPALGRFLSMDLMMDGANWYIYCAGNPVLFLDTNGYEMYTRPDGSVWDRPSASEIRNAEINGWDTPKERLIRTGNQKPSKQTPVKGSLKDNAVEVVKNVGIAAGVQGADDVIAHIVGKIPTLKSVTRYSQTTAPLFEQTWTRFNNIPVKGSGAINGAKAFTRTAGVVGTAAVAYDVYNDFQEYEGGDAGGAVALAVGGAAATVAAGIGITAGAALLPVTLPAVAVFGVIVAAGMGISWLVDKAKDAWLEKKK